MKALPIPFRKKLALRLYSRYKKNESLLHPLNYLFWECTLRCNLQCRHCGSDCRKDAVVQDMPAEDFLRALDEISGIVKPNHTTIVFTGGEALLRKDLEAVGLQLYARGFPWGLVTNGWLLSRQRFESLLEAGMRSITISLDGLETSHDWLRGTGSHARVMQGISLLPAQANLEYDVVTCVHQRNFSELEQIRDLLLQTGIRRWRVFTVFPTGRAKEHPELQLEPQQFNALFEFIRQTRKEGRIALNYGCEGFLGNYEGEVRDAFFFCRAGIHIASILADGSISACPNLRQHFVQGNIYNDNFREVWENRYQVFRDRSWTKTGICAGCEFHKYCEGNGMHLRDEDGGLLFCHLRRME